MERIYLYLGKRDKKGVKVLTVLMGEHTSPNRITDLNELQLPNEVHKELEVMIHDNRMEWEPWIESANTYQELRASLKKRGYKNLPIHSMPMADSTNLLTPHVANTEKMPAPAVMLQKPRRRL